MSAIEKCEFKVIEMLNDDKAIVRVSGFVYGDMGVALTKSVLWSLVRPDKGRHAPGAIVFLDLDHACSAMVDIVDSGCAPYREGGYSEKELTPVLEIAHRHGGASLEKATRDRTYRDAHGDFITKLCALMERKAL